MLHAGRTARPPPAAARSAVPHATPVLRARPLGQSGRAACWRRLSTRSVLCGEKGGLPGERDYAPLTVRRRTGPAGTRSRDAKGPRKRRRSVPWEAAGSCVSVRSVPRGLGFFILRWGCGARDGPKLEAGAHRVRTGDVHQRRAAMRGCARVYVGPSLAGSARGAAGPFRTPICGKAAGG